MRRLSLAAVAVCLCAFAASGQSGPKPAIDLAALEAYLRYLYPLGPHIRVQLSNPKPCALSGLYEVTLLATAGTASHQETFLVSADGQKIVRGTLYDIRQSPFQTELSRLKTAGEPAFGAEGAAVNIAIFSDFQCSYCREEAKTLRQNLGTSFPKEARVYFKDYPLDQIHPWARTAAIAGRCIFRQNSAAFWDYHDWIFDHQNEITPENLQAKVLEFAKGKGVEPVQLNTCLADKATEADVNRSVAEGRALGVNSTPTMFINGRRVVGQVAWVELRKLIESEIQYKKSSGKEKCCEIKLDTPGRAQ
ncbi:MAG: DsbA family protein [Acidobacteria bacterium]|nr:DsbA family protein [Acidobacteriota bacterium]